IVPGNRPGAFGKVNPSRGVESQAGSAADHRAGARASDPREIRAAARDRGKGSVGELTHLANLREVQTTSRIDRHPHPFNTGKQPSWSHPALLAVRYT